MDDDPDDFELLCDALKVINPAATCEYRRDGEKALSLLRERSVKPPEYIFLDVHIPGMGGRECLEHQGRPALTAYTGYPFQ